MDLVTDELTRLHVAFTIKPDGIQLLNRSKIPVYFLEIVNLFTRGSVIPTKEVFKLAECLTSIFPPRLPFHGLDYLYLYLRTIRPRAQWIKTHFELKTCSR